MFKLPPNKQWMQHNQSDVLGSLLASFNLDLQSNKGKTRVSPRLLLTTDDLAGMGTPCAFQHFYYEETGARCYWMVSGVFVWRAVVTNGYITAFAKDNVTLTPNAGAASSSCDDTISDMVTLGHTDLVVTTRTNMYFLGFSADTWDGVGEDAMTDGVTSGTPHMMCVYNGRVYVTDAALTVRSTDSSFASLTSSGANWLNLAATAYPITRLTTIRTVSDGIWVFTINQQENNCWAFKWDGVSAADPNRAYEITGSSGVLAAIIIDDTPWIITNNARLMYFNGGTFVEAPNGKLPIKNTKLLKNSLSGINDRWIHPNGISLRNRKIDIFINNEYEDSAASIEENLPSGIWEYDSEIGWTHVNSLSSHAASAGSVKDYGQNRISVAGALMIQNTDGASATKNGTMLVGAKYFSTATATKFGVFTDDSNDTLQKYGYLITQKIYSENIDETFQAAVVRFPKLLASTDSITLKYRVDFEDVTEATITWVDTNTFTSTADLSDYAVGHEVEIIQGDGSGKSAHITAISSNAGTYTVDLDDTFTGVTTNTAKARFNKWIKAGVCTDQTVRHYRYSTPEAVGTYIQLKICMQFTGRGEIDDVLLINQEHQLAQ